MEGNVIMEHAIVLLVSKENIAKKNPVLMTALIMGYAKIILVFAKKTFSVLIAR